MKRTVVPLTLAGAAFRCAARRDVLRAMAAASLVFVCAAAASPAAASGYPAKPITLILPFPPGGSIDALVRTLTDTIAADLGQPVVLMHKPGGGGVTATAALATMGDADGYTLAVMHNSILRQPHMTKVTWSPLSDFSYITGLASMNTGIAVSSDAPWKSLAELLTDAKKRPGEISWGNVGVSSSNRIYSERLARAAGVRLNFVPFKGGAEHVNAVIGRHVDVYCDPGFGPMTRHGKLRLLATFTEQRLPGYPQVPTVKELGYDLVVQSPFGIVAPRNLPPAISSTLQAAIRKAEKNPVYQLLLSEYNMTPWPVDAAAYRAYAQAQFPREKQMLDEIGFKPE